MPGPGNRQKLMPDPHPRQSARKRGRAQIRGALFGGGTEPAAGPET